MGGKGSDMYCGCTKIIAVVSKGTAGGELTRRPGRLLGGGVVQNQDWDSETGKRNGGRGGSRRMCPLGGFWKAAHMSVGNFSVKLVARASTIPAPSPSTNGVGHAQHDKLTARSKEDEAMITMISASKCHLLTSWTKRLPANARRDHACT